MDKKDEFILESLMKEGRMPFTHIASEMGITETAVRKRVRKLESRGIIRGYTTIMDPFYLGYEGVALVGVDAKPEKVVDVFESIKTMSVIRYSALTSGDHMMMFEVWCRNPSKLNRFLKDIEGMDGVTRVCPAVMLKRVE
jgi:Lrp/AsnC family transcriptional regulator for asnA, asnC and gidA